MNLIFSLILLVVLSTCIFVEKRLKRQAISSDHIKIHSTDSSVFMNDFINVLSTDSRIQLQERDMNGTFWSAFSKMQFDAFDTFVNASFNSVYFRLNTTSCNFIQGTSMESSLYMKTNRTTDGYTQFFYSAYDNANMTVFEENIRIQGSNAQRIDIESTTWNRHFEKSITISELKSNTGADGIELKVISSNYSTAIRFFNSDFLIKFHDRFISINPSLSLIDIFHGNYHYCFNANHAANALHMNFTQDRIIISDQQGIFYAVISFDDITLHILYMSQAVINRGAAKLMLGDHLVEAHNVSISSFQSTFCLSKNGMLQADTIKSEMRMITAIENVSMAAQHQKIKIIGVVPKLTVTAGYYFFEAKRIDGIPSSYQFSKEVYPTEDSINSNFSSQVSSTPTDSFLFTSTPHTTPSTLFDGSATTTTEPINPQSLKLSDGTARTKNPGEWNSEENVKDDGKNETETINFPNGTTVTRRINIRHEVVYTKFPSPTNLNFTSEVYDCSNKFFPDGNLTYSNLETSSLPTTRSILTTQPNVEATTVETRTNTPATQVNISLESLKTSTMSSLFPEIPTTTNLYQTDSIDHYQTTTEKPNYNASRSSQILSSTSSTIEYSTSGTRDFFHETQPGFTIITSTPPHSSEPADNDYTKANNLDPIEPTEGPIQTTEPYPLPFDFATEAFVIGHWFSTSESGTKHATKPSIVDIDASIAHVIGPTASLLTNSEAPSPEPLLIQPVDYDESSLGSTSSPESFTEHSRTPSSINPLSPNEKMLLLKLKVPNEIDVRSIQFMKNITKSLDVMIHNIPLFSKNHKRDTADNQSIGKELFPEFNPDSTETRRKRLKVNNITREMDVASVVFTIQEEEETELDKERSNMQQLMYDLDNEILQKYLHFQSPEKIYRYSSAPREVFSVFKFFLYSLLIIDSL